MPDRPRRPWIGIPAHPGFAAAERLAAELAAAHAARQAALQPSRFELVVPQIQIDHDAALRGIEQAGQAWRAGQRELRELERLVSERSAWLTGFDANKKAAQAFAAGLRMDTAAAAERHAAMIKATMVDARTSEIISGYSRAQIDALRFGQQPFGHQSWRDLSREYEVQEQPDSPLVTTKKNYRGGAAKRASWTRLRDQSLEDLICRFWLLQGDYGYPPSLERLAASFYGSNRNVVRRRLIQLGLTLGQEWQQFKALCFQVGPEILNGTNGTDTLLRDR